MRPCCSAAWSNVHPQKAAYVKWWTHGMRYAHYLCLNCCGWWLLNALDDPGLTPDAIELL